MDLSELSSSVSADIEKELMQVLKGGVASKDVVEESSPQQQLSDATQPEGQEEEGEEGEGEGESSLSSLLSPPQYVPTTTTASSSMVAGMSQSVVAGMSQSVVAGMSQSMVGIQLYSKTSLNSSLKRRLGE